MWHIGFILYLWYICSHATRRGDFCIVCDICDVRKICDVCDVCEICKICNVWDVREICKVCDVSDAKIELPSFVWWSAWNQSHFLNRS